jgi:uncharacterized protein YigE (DUF2233 family)
MVMEEQVHPEQLIDRNDTTRLYHCGIKRNGNARIQFVIDTRNQNFIETNQGVS